MSMYKYLLFSAVGLMIGCDKTQKQTEAVELVTFEDSVSYALGLSQARSVAASASDYGFNLDAVSVGFSAGLDSSASVLLTDDDLAVINQKFKAVVSQKRQEENARLEAEAKAFEEAQYEKYKGNIEIEKSFLAENKKKEGVKVTGSGLQYRVLQAGTGNKPIASNLVKVHYTGKLLDGTIFDSSVERGQPSTFGVTQVIKGWIEGLQLMPVGAKYEFFIPYELAYGERGQGQSIPPFSTLIFEVELLEIVK